MPCNNQVRFYLFEYNLLFLFHIEDYGSIINLLGRLIMVYEIMNLYIFFCLSNSTLPDIKDL